jgi:pyridoxal phosphate enzyme (YggS family)
MLPAETIQKNIKSILQNISMAEKNAMRAPGSVRLLAVSKTFPSESVRAAASAGQKLFAENYVQEALPKIQELESLPLEWHFIGHLQTNKVKMLADRFALIHSVDRMKLAKELSERSLKKQKILIEVNLANEVSKSGCPPKELPHLIEAVQGMERIELSGLMFMPPLGISVEEQRQYFATAAALHQSMTKYLSSGHDLSELSMGTSHDYMEAIAAGSTIVRLGSIIFGERH